MAVRLTRLEDIAIRVESAGGTAPTGPAGPAAAGGLGGGVAAVLSELVTLLEQLVRSETPAAIDLRSLPMSPQDRAELEQVLGEGEVRAEVSAQGLSTVRETRTSGVWWVEHRDAQGEPVAEFLEVTRIPQILSSALDEIAAAAATLRAQIDARGAGRSNQERC
jgi:hydrogenase-1 operon protein HyaF